MIDISSNDLTPVTPIFEDFVANYKFDHTSAVLKRQVPSSWHSILSIMYNCVRGRVSGLLILAVCITAATFWVCEVLSLLDNSPAANCDISR